MVTDRPGVLLGILTADCAPVLLADAEAGVVGAAHAGWRGALAGVTDAALAAMEALGARRERIAAAVGPCIGQASYEVDAQFRDRFIAADAANAPFSPSPPASRTSTSKAMSSPGCGQRESAKVAALGLDTYARSRPLLQLSPLDPSRRAQTTAARSA